MNDPWDQFHWDEYPWDEYPWDETLGTNRPRMNPLGMKALWDECSVG